jgi:hypothetical protein
MGATTPILLGWECQKGITSLEWEVGESRFCLMKLETADGIMTLALGAFVGHLTIKLYCPHVYISSIY